MRKSVFVLIMLGFGCIGYQAWPVTALVKLMRAVDARDVAAVVEHVDVQAVSRSLNEQIVETYLKMTGQTGGSPLLRGIVTASVSIADPIIAKIVAPEALTEFLRTGWPTSVLPDRPPGTIGLSNEQLGSAWQIYWNSRTWFRRYEIEVPPSHPPERRLGLEFRLVQWRWRLVKVRLPDDLRMHHSEGRPPNNPINGKYWGWAVGFDVGKNLADYWKLEEFKPGEQTFFHYADGSGHKNRMQGNDFVQSAMYTHGVACNSCHDVHGTANNADLIKPANSICLNCHGPNSPNGPRGASIEAHTHHQKGSAGNECVGCHMPKIAQQIADVNIRSHTFKFIPPSETETLKVPNGCTSCHTDKSNEWAKESLRTWPNVSPWRVAQ